MEIVVDLNGWLWYDQYMKKTNNKVSQHKAKRYAKNKKRLKNKPHLSKFERQQIAKRAEILGASLQSMTANGR